MIKFVSGYGLIVRVSCIRLSFWCMKIYTATPDCISCTRLWRSLTDVRLGNLLAYWHCTGVLLWDHSLKSREDWLF